MSRLGEALGSLAITMVSPDGHIQLESRGGRRPVVTFVDSDAYFDYDAGALKAQLEALLVGFAAELRAARHTAVREHSKLGVNDSPHWNAEVRRANEQQLNVASFGTSIDEFVVTESVGLRDWTVILGANALTELSPAEFLREVNSALLDTYQCHAEKLHELKQAQAL